jgi:hypothetical protein
MKRVFVFDGNFIGPASRALAGLIAFAAIFTLIHCGSRSKSAKSLKSELAQRAGMDIPESTSLTASGPISGPPSVRFGPVDVWYRDSGDSILLATRSGGRVLLHVDLDNNGVADERADLIYAPLDRSSVCAEYWRPEWASASWGEFKTAATVHLRRSGSDWEEIWKLPKRELDTTGGTVSVVFQVFDEETQSSSFYPATPFTEVAKLNVSNFTSELVSSTPPTQTGPPAGTQGESPSGARPPANVPGAKQIRAQPPAAVRPTESVKEVLHEVSPSVSSPVPDDPAAGKRSFILEVFSRTKRIQKGSSFAIDDPTLGELGHGDLKARVWVDGPAVPRNRLTIEWTVNGVVTDRQKSVLSNALVEYGNEPTAGIYKVTVRLDGQTVSEFMFGIAQ